MFGKTCIKWYFIFALALFCESSANLSRIDPYGMLGLPPLPSSNDPIPTGNLFTQILDHYNTTDPRKWSQRYHVVKDYYKVGGPVFIMIGGEVKFAPASMDNAAWVDYAKNFNALMFMLEHRFYGPGPPFRDLSVENLKYLSSAQALSDVAYFIVGMNSLHGLPPDTKWVAFGGSYAGNLAAWVRYKYPHLVHAAVASSAPVLAQVDFREYLDAVRVSLSSHSSECVQAVEDAHRRVKSLLKTQHGREMIQVNFRLCFPIDHNNQNDVALLLSTLSIPFSNVVQNNKFWFQVLNIEQLCNIMVNRNVGDPVLRMAEVNNIFYKNISCLNIKYNDLINYMKNDIYTSDSRRLWFYQQCTEFGYFQTSENERALFGKDFPIDFFTQQCGDIFGKKFTKESIYQAVHKTNRMYGGLDIKATRVVYVHGSLDPYHTLGITKTRIPESPAIFINGTSHATDMMPPSRADPPALRAARKEIYSLIRTWLREPYYNFGSSPKL